MYKSILLGDIDESQREHKQRLVKILKRYLPAVAVEYCSELIILYKLHLHIEVERKDRLGDYSPHLGLGNRISINHNLSPFDFLITFAHELAHHTAWKKFGNKHEPHGKEWKEEFRIHMRPMVRLHFFPPDLEDAVIRHMKNPRYTHSGDLELTRALMKHSNEQATLLDDLPTGALFKMSARARIVMRKGEKKRTYITCADIAGGKTYLVHAVAKVIVVTGK